MPRDRRVFGNNTNTYPGQNLNNCVAWSFLQVDPLLVYYLGYSFGIFMFRSTAFPTSLSANNRKRSLKVTREIYDFVDIWKCISKFAPLFTSRARKTSPRIWLKRPWEQAVPTLTKPLDQPELR